MIAKTIDQSNKLKSIQVGMTSRLTGFALLFLLVSLFFAFLPSDAIAGQNSKDGLVTEGTITKYEAEDAVLSGVSISSSGTGFSGTGFMDGGTMDTEGDKITFTVNVATKASYPLIIRFLNTCGACEKVQNVSINGGANKSASLIGTGSAWEDMNFGNIDLNAGTNTIAISKSWGWSHIDYIGIGENDVTAPTAPANLKFANVNQTSFTLSWDASTDNVAVTGYDIYFGATLKVSTTATTIGISNLTCNTEYANITVKAKDYAGHFSEPSNVISVTTGACMQYALTVNNGTGSGSYNSGKVIAIAANAAPAGKIFDKWTGSTAIANANVSITTIVMPEAATEITATYKDVDPALLLDPAATPETVNLWNYLKSIYGQKMLTGCWTETQFGGNAKVVSCSGETPAIWGQDMNSWYRSRTEFNWINTWAQNIAGFKNAYKRGQILQLNWHWQMPSSKVNGAYTRDAWGKNSAGVQLMMTAQQWADIVTPGTALYDAMIEDIDYHVVNFLKKLVDTNGKPIPIIFRPLHEIDGGWFWWTCPSDPTKTAKLYKIMQDRIINYHGCHNLIWVYNPGVICDGGSWPPYQSSEFARRRLFYPGDAYCDITGIDLYGFDPAVRGTYGTTGKTYRDAWNTMKAISPNKMIALCESEGLPNPDKCFTDSKYAPWLYCLPWFSDSYGDDATGLTRDLCAWNKIQFKSAYVINAGDFNITANENTLPQEQPGISIYPNPATNYVTISIHDEKLSGEVMLTMFDLSGKMIYQSEMGKHKSLRIFTGDLIKGLYMLKISDHQDTLCGKLVIQ
ncbi:MAG TPA: glycosyl hydrolase [Prolixibacteraceae bacterium]|jgi:mannan endo-1,4-beta-mannosidase